MRSISVRELRRNASKYLEDVAAGESIEITDRGSPVARLVRPGNCSTTGCAVSFKSLASYPGQEGAARPTTL
jgi:hypothetical protein